MRRVLIIPAMLTLLGGCAAGGLHGASPRAMADRAVARGQVFVQRSCAGCHVVGALGDSPDKRAPPFRLLRLRLGDLDLEPRLAEISRNGHVQMPPIYMTDPEIKDVAAYIRTVQVDPRPKAEQVSLAAPPPG